MKAAHESNQSPRSSMHGAGRSMRHVLAEFVTACVALLLIPGNTASGADLEDWQRKGLLATLGDSRADVQEAAMRRAAALEALDIVPSRIAAQLVHSKDAEVREHAIVALGLAGEPPAAATIADALSAEEGPLRAAAAIALGRLNVESYAPRVVELLGDEEWEVRRAALYALGAMRATNYAARIAEMVRDPNDKVRREAVVALSVLRDDAQHRS